MTGLKPSLDALKSPVCQCGDTKKPYAILCPQCIAKLPPAMWDKLDNALMGAGYEQNYEACKIYLGTVKEKS